MNGKKDAMERCAYCRNYVPVTPVDVGADAQDDEGLRAVVTVCQSCANDGR